MRNLVMAADLDRSIRDLRCRRDLLEEIIAALTRYRELSHDVACESWNPGRRLRTPVTPESKRRGI